MDNFSIIFAIEAIVIFAVVVLILNSVFKDEQKRKIKIRKSLYRSFSVKTIIYMLLASLALTYFVNQFAKSLISSAIIFITVMGLLPNFINNNLQRIKREDMFKDVIVYCSNMGLLLKQTKNAFASLKAVKNDVGVELAGDIQILLDAMDQSKEATKEVMQDFEKKYPYTIINNLNIMMFQHENEKGKMSDELLNTYMDDVAALEQDVKENKQKRNVMRVTYFGLTAGGIAMFAYFYNTMVKTSLADIYDSSTFKIIVLVYFVLSFVALAFTDRLFCSTTTKE